MKRILYSLIITAAFLTVPVGIIFAAHIEDGINQVAVSFSNLTGGTEDSLQAPFNLSSVGLSESLFIAADGLDVDVKEGNNHIAFMPGSTRIQMLGCFTNAAANQTAGCNDATVDDLALPTLNGEIFEFAADNQFRILHVNVTTPAVANWTVVWEYWNGSAYVAFTNVSDNTDGFTIAGLHTVSFDFPAADLWGLETLHAIEGYWIQARVSAVTTITSVPIGGQAWYETGRWWTIIPDIAPSQEVQYNVHLDVPDSDKTFHYYFPHTDGVSVTSSSTVSLTGSYVAEWTGYFDMTAPVTGTTKKIGFKSGAIEITIPADGIIQARIFE